MSWFVMDVESDGPVPGRYSIVSFGAVLVEPSLSQTFYGRTKPVSQQFIADALASAATRVMSTKRLTTPPT